MSELQWCNWSFDEFIQKGKWFVQRDCEEEPIVLSRGDSRNWKAYMSSLKPQEQTMHPEPRLGAQCPNCGKQVNGVNPFDDGETWRR